MTKEQKQLTVIAVGVAVLAVVLILNSRDAKKEGGDSAPEETTASVGEAAAPEVEAARKGRSKIPPAVLEKQQIAAAEPYGRDPFTFSSAKPERAAPRSADPKQVSVSLSLSAISIREGAAPMAVINDSITRIGDKIGDVEIAGIYKDYVLLKKGGKEYKLELEK